MTQYVKIIRTLSLGTGRFSLRINGGFSPRAPRTLDIGCGGGLRDGDDADTPTTSPRVRAGGCRLGSVGLPLEARRGGGGDGDGDGGRGRTRGFGGGGAGFARGFGRERGTENEREL